MSNERIAGFMMGISVGVAIGYYLNPHKHDLPAETGPKLKSESANQPPAPGASSQANTAAARAR